MEDSKKKPIMIGAIVVCIALAIVITLMRGSESTGVDSIARGQMTWVKCSNEDCGAEYQMDRRDYYEWQKENTDPFATQATPMVCKECGEEYVTKKPLVTVVAYESDMHAVSDYIRYDNTKEICTRTAKRRGRPAKIKVRK